MKFKIGDKVFFDRQVGLQTLASTSSGVRRVPSGTYSQHGVVCGLPCWEGDHYLVGIGGQKYAQPFHEKELTFWEDAPTG